jgi:hypothetical protein
MKNISVHQNSDGQWIIIIGRVLEKTFDTNAAAWRFVDRKIGAPISASEAAGDWISLP